jgi:hypothetical protein
MAKANADFLKSYLPGVEIVSLKEGIHDLQLQKPEEVARLISEFLARSKTDRQSEITKSQIPNPK